MAQSFFSRVTSGAYSGLQRYPRHLWASMREAAAGARHSDHLTRRVWTQNSNHGSRGVQEDRFTATWIGHATLLLRFGDTTVLTDPVFSNRIGMSVATRTFGLARLRPPSCKLDDLPPVNLIVLSHAHFDHLDKPTLQHLASDRTVVVTAARTRRLIPKGFAEVVELEWGSTFQHSGLAITALRPAHWGARTAVDQRRGYSSYLIESPETRVFFAGDTADTRAFDSVHGVDLAIFGIGAYEPWLNAHANPEQVWEMFSRMQAKHLLPMHHSTFELGREPLAEPMQRLHAAAREAWDRVVVHDVGETWKIPAA